MADINKMTQTQLEEFFRNTMVGYDYDTMRNVLEALRQIFLGDMETVRLFLINAETSIINSEQLVEEARDYASRSLAIAEDTKNQFDAVVERETDSDAMSRQAAFDINNVDHQTLKARLDNDYKYLLSEQESIEKLQNQEKNRLDQLAEASKTNYESLNAEINTPHMVGNLEYPLYIAHRGAAGLYQEHTLLAYESHIARGNTLVELDVQQTIDGSLVVMHDDSIYRTTNGSGKVYELTTSYLKNREVTDKLDSRTSIGDTYGYKPQPIPTLKDVLERFGKSATYFIESKDKRSAALIVDEVKSRNLEGYVIIQSFSLTDLQQVSEEGIELLYLSDDIQESEYQTIANQNINFIGVSKRVSDGYIQSLKAAGFRVLVYTVNHRYEKDRLLNLGVDGFFSDEPFYLDGSNPKLSKDTFREKVFPDGMIPMYANYKGEFNTNKYSPFTWGFLKESTVPDGRDFVLQGYLDSTPSTFSISFSVTKLENATNSWASIAVCLQNDYFDDNKNPHLSKGGYHLLFSNTGRMLIYKVMDEGAVKLKERDIGETWDVGMKADLMVTVTDTEIIFERLDIPYSITAYDNDFRGGYIALGRRFAAFNFSDVTLI